MINEQFCFLSVLYFVVIQDDAKKFSSPSTSKEQNNNKKGQNEVMTVYARTFQRGLNATTHSLSLYNCKVGRAVCRPPKCTVSCVRVNVCLS